MEVPSTLDESQVMDGCNLEVEVDKERRWAAEEQRSRADT